MHDFCVTIPYGMVMIIGGGMGYVTKGSIASLAGGAGTGLLLLLSGFLSLSAFNLRKNSPLASFLQSSCAIMLTYVMGQRYARTSKIMPAGLVAGISVIMTVFYLYKFATGGNKIPPKTE